MTFNKNIGLGIALLIILLNVFIGRYFAPTGIFSIPFVVIAITALISLNKNKFNPFLHVLIVYLLIGINDVGIKLYAGRIHDWQGLGWIHMMLFIGLIPSFVTLAIGIKAVKFAERILPMSLFIALMALHLFAFGELGLGRSYISLP